MRSPPVWSGNRNGRRSVGSRRPSTPTEPPSPARARFVLPQQQRRRSGRKSCGSYRMLKKVRSYCGVIPWSGKMVVHVSNVFGCTALFQQPRRTWMFLGTRWRTPPHTREEVPPLPRPPRLSPCPLWELRRYPADTHQLRPSPGRAPSEASRSSVRRRLPSRDRCRCVWTSCPPPCSGSPTSPWKIQVRLGSCVSSSFITLHIRVNYLFSLVLEIYFTHSQNTTIFYLRMSRVLSFRYFSDTFSSINSGSPFPGVLL